MSSDDYKPKASIRKGTNLPVPVTGTALQADELVKLASELTTLTEDIEAWHPVDEERLARNVATWAAVDRPASLEEIGVVVSYLVHGQPTANNVNIDLLSETLFDDIVGWRPTFFALHIASQAMRMKRKFFDQPWLFQKLRDAEFQSRRFRQALERKSPAWLAAEREEDEKDRQREERRLRKEQERLDNLKKTDPAAYEREVRSEMNEEDLWEEYQAKHEAARLALLKKKERK